MSKQKRSRAGIISVAALTLIGGWFLTRDYCSPPPPKDPVVTVDGESPPPVDKENLDSLAEQSRSWLGRALYRIVEGSKKPTFDRLERRASACINDVLNVEIYCVAKPDGTPNLKSMRFLSRPGWVPPKIPNTSVTPCTSFGTLSHHLRSVFSATGAYTDHYDQYGNPVPGEHTTNGWELDDKQYTEGRADKLTEVTDCLNGSELSLWNSRIAAKWNADNRFKHEVIDGIRSRTVGIGDVTNVLNLYEKALKELDELDQNDSKVRAARREIYEGIFEQATIAIEIHDFYSYGEGPNHSDRRKEDYSDSPVLARILNFYDGMNRPDFESRLFNKVHDADRAFDSAIRAIKRFDDLDEDAQYNFIFGLTDVGWGGIPYKRTVDQAVALDRALQNTLRNGSDQKREWDVYVASHLWMFGQGE